MNGRPKEKKHHQEHEGGIKEKTDIIIKNLKNRNLISLLEKEKEKILDLSESLKSEGDNLEIKNELEEAKKIFNLCKKELDDRSNRLYSEITALKGEISSEEIKNKIKNIRKEIKNINPVIRNYLNKILNKKIISLKEEKIKDLPKEKEIEILSVPEEKIEEKTEAPPTPEPAPPLSEEELEEIAKEQLEEKKERIFWVNIEGLTGEAAEKLMIPNESRNKVINSLEEIKKRYIWQFIKEEWLPAHQEKIKEMGFPSKEKLGDSVILQLFKEMGGDQELEKKKGLVSEVLPLVILDWKEKSPTLESRLLALIFLNDQLSFLEKELEKIEEPELSEEKKEKKKDLINKEIEKLFDIRKELAEKTTGRDLRKEAEEKIPFFLPNKKEYVNDYLNLFQKEEEGWFFWKKFIIIEEEIKRHSFKNEKEREDFLQKEKQKKEEEWSKEKEGYIKILIENEITSLTPSSPEEGEKTIKNFWERIRKKLIEEEKKRIEAGNEKLEEKAKPAIRPEMPDVEELKLPKNFIKKECEKASYCPLVKTLEKLLKEHFTGNFDKDIDKLIKFLRELKTKPKPNDIENLKKNYVKLAGETGENIEGIACWLCNSVFWLYIKLIETIFREAAKRGGIDLFSAKKS